jgi:hypothetical protein
VADYYTIESARGQILQIGHIEKGFAPQLFPDDWNFCPCNLDQMGRCFKDRCIIKLPICLNDPFIGQFPLEIIYIKNRGGFISVTNMRLKRFISAGIIDINALNIVQL